MKICGACGQPIVPDEHIVEFRVDGWSIQHPLPCRPNLQDCLLHIQISQRIDEYGLPPLGRFCCWLNGEGLVEIDSQRVEEP